MQAAGRWAAAYKTAETPAQYRQHLLTWLRDEGWLADPPLYQDYKAKAPVGSPHSQKPKAAKAKPVASKRGRPPKVATKTKARAKTKVDGRAASKRKPPKEQKLPCRICGTIIDMSKGGGTGWVGAVTSPTHVTCVKERPRQREKCDVSS